MNINNLRWPAEEDSGDYVILWKKSKGYKAVLVPEAKRVVGNG